MTSTPSRCPPPFNLSAWPHRSAVCVPRSHRLRTDHINTGILPSTLQMMAAQMSQSDDRSLLALLPAEALTSKPSPPDPKLLSFSCPTTRSLFWPWCSLALVQPCGQGDVSS